MLKSAGGMGGGVGAMGGMGDGSARASGHVRRYVASESYARGEADSQCAAAADAAAGQRSSRRRALIQSRVFSRSIRSRRSHRSAASPPRRRFDERGRKGF
uniref:Uncharacterized protein n=1 Tax=Odontella aurita TaxID=265563 RepID=A0A6U6GF12_9STRA|mmetsp:Transcript_41678/g.126400  ORF Transcript_41678/g.126400 Transcript_41678/m.126400 type:complete len:101 (+) Transcript_41678:853-1155(+)